MLLKLKYHWKPFFTQLTFSSKSKFLLGCLFLVPIIFHTYWMPSMMVYKCLLSIAPRVQINSSVPILKKKKQRGRAELSSLSIFPLWTCQQRALKRPCRERTPKPAPAARVASIGASRFVQGWLKRKIECKIPDIQFIQATSYPSLNK